MPKPVDVHCSTAALREWTMLFTSTKGRMVTSIVTLHSGTTASCLRRRSPQSWHDDKSLMSTCVAWPMTSVSVRDVYLCGLAYDVCVGT